MRNVNPRPLAVLLLATITGIANLLIKAKTVVYDMGNNLLLFPTPSPTLASVTTHVGALETAEVLAKTKAVGTVAARDVKANAVVGDLKGLLSYVQTLADAITDQAVAISIIQAAGFDVKVNGVRVKPPLAAKSGIEEVKLIAKATKKGKSYIWQMSTDGGATWTYITTTTKANYLVKGLTSGAKLQFKVQAVTKAGPQPWTNPVSTIVL